MDKQVGPSMAKDRESGSPRLGIRLWGLLIAAGMVASAGTLLGFLGRFSWWLDLFSHFRVQYLPGLLVSGVLLLAGRRRWTAALFVALALVNFTTVFPLYLGRPQQPAGSSPVLRAMLLNVNTRLGDADRVTAVVPDADPDILVLEEISAAWMSDLAWLADSHPHSLVEPREDNFGIGLFSKLPLVEADVVYIGDAGVPSIIATVRTAHADLRVIATHPVPPAGREYSRWRNSQLEQLPDHIRSPLPVLVLGDLNVTPWSYHFRRLLASTGLRDSAKGYGVQPTWPSHNPLLRIPIDHCLHSPDIAIVDRRVGENVSSDHYPVIIDFVVRRKQTKAESATAPVDDGAIRGSGEGAMP